MLMVRSYYLTLRQAEIETDTAIDKLAQNTMGICIGVCLCAV